MMTDLTLSRANYPNDFIIGTKADIKWPDGVTYFKFQFCIHSDIS